MPENQMKRSINSLDNSDQLHPDVAESSAHQLKNFNGRLKRLESTVIAMNEKLVDFGNSMLKMQAAVHKKEDSTTIRIGSNKGFLHATSNISDLLKDENGTISKRIKVAGADWWLRVRKHCRAGEEQTLGVYLYCNAGSTSVSYDTNYTIRLLGSPENIEFEGISLFSYKYNPWGWRSIVPLSKLVNVVDGFVDEKGDFKIQAEFSVREKISDEVALDTQFLTSGLVESDSTIVVEGRRFPVNKGLLSACSSYFKGLFFGQFRGKNEDEILIKDACAAEFLHLIKAMYPRGVSVADSDGVNHENVECLLRLADFYQVKVVLNQCAVYLEKCAMTEVAIEDKLLYAQEYRLSDLLEVCIKEFKTLADVKKLYGTGQYSQLRQDIKLRIHEEIL